MSYFFRSRICQLAALLGLCLKCGIVSSYRPTDIIKHDRSPIKMSHMFHLALKFSSKKVCLLSKCDSFRIYLFSRCSRKLLKQSLLFRFFFFLHTTTHLKSLSMRRCMFVLRAVSMRRCMFVLRAVSMRRCMFVLRAVSMRRCMFVLRAVSHRDADLIFIFITPCTPQTNLVQLVTLDGLPVCC